MMMATPGDTGLTSPEQDNYDPLLNHKDSDDDLVEGFECTPDVCSLPNSELGSPNSTRSSDSMAESFSSSSSTANRNKFLYPKIDTVETLRPEQVRWLYKEDGDKKWTPFIGYDSLRIECKYREYMSRAAPGPSGASEDTIEMVIVRGGLYEVDVISKKCFPIYWSLEGDTSVVMRGMWFIEGHSWQPLEEGYADQIETEHLAKFENQKIPDETADANKGPIPVIHNIKFKEFYVDWNSIDNVFLHSEATSSRFYRALGNKLGLARGTRLHRGYCYEATMDDKPPDIQHLVFVIHGIGQKMETGSIIKSCNQLREITAKLREKYLPDLDTDNKRAEFLPVEWRSSLTLDGDTVESITPNKVRGLRTILNSSAMDILYYTSPLYRSEITHGLQTELNGLYQKFCTRHPYFEASGGKVSIVAHSLGVVITYDIITGWNPIQLYDQYVSSVIEERCAEAEGTGDLISELEEARQKVSNLESELLSLAQKQHLKKPTLKFKVENFFCLGSPLAVFLALRGIRPKGDGSQNDILPQSLCSRLFNVYHPSDPIAYRLEPLILKHYATISPLRIHRADSSNKVPYEEMKATAYSAALTGDKSNNSSPAKFPNEKDLGEDLSDEDAEIKVIVTEDLEPEKGKEKEKDKLGITGRLSGMFAKFGRKSPTPDILSTELPEITKKSPVEKEKSPFVSPVVSPGIEKKPLPDGDSPIEQTQLEYRLDYMLKEGKMENAYISALTSHTGYWANADIALFLTTNVFPGYNPR